MAKNRQQLLVDSLRRLIRRGADAHLRRMVQKARSEDIAEAMEELQTPQARHVLLQLLPEPARAAEVVAAYDHARLGELFTGVTPQQLKPVFQKLASDDAADILALIPEEMKTAILEAMKPEESEGIEELMGYGPDTAGGIMSTDFFAMDKESTARETIVALQENPDVEGVFYVYCINDDRTLVGVLSLRQLLLVPPNTQLKSIMNSDVIAVPVTTDQEEVAQIVARYDLLGLPVVDQFNKLVGLITVDDVIDVLRDEATEDMMRMAGVGDEDVALRSVGTALRTRLPWLMASVVGGIGSAFLITRFESELAKAAILASFIPVTMGLGGNVGVQASTIVVRGIAMGQLDPTKFLEALFSELKVVLGLALTCSLAMGGAALVMGGWSSQLALTVTAAIALVMLVGAVLGTSVPLVSNRLGIDPAVATGPILTTSIDIIAVSVYFTLASLWMGV
jgi:magnesium transporter